MFYYYYVYLLALEMNVACQSLTDMAARPWFHTLYVKQSALYAKTYMLLNPLYSTYVGHIQLHDV